ncbi:bridging integrator 2 [Sarotherodon galilaeus]
MDEWTLLTTPRYGEFVSHIDYLFSGRGRLAEESPSNEACITIATLSVRTVSGNVKRSIFNRCGYIKYCCLLEGVTVGTHPRAQLGVRGAGAPE